MATIDVYHAFDDGPRRAAVLRQAGHHAEACAADGADPDWLQWWQRTESMLRDRAIGGRVIGRLLAREREEESFWAAGEIHARAQWLLVGERLPAGDSGPAMAP